MAAALANESARLKVKHLARLEAKSQQEQKKAQQAKQAAAARERSVEQQATLAAQEHAGQVQIQRRVIQLQKIQAQGLHNPAHLETMGEEKVTSAELAKWLRKGNEWDNYMIKQLQ